MPAVGEDGSIYAVAKDDNGKRVNSRILEKVQTSPKGGRYSLILTEDGEEWLTMEIGKGSDVDDLAKELGIDVSTLYTPKNREKTQRAVKNGAGLVNNRLRKAQIKAALNGNATMLVWLGKNRLGQSDSPRGEGNAILADFAQSIVKASKNIDRKEMEGWEE